MSLFLPIVSVKEPHLYGNHENMMDDKEAFVGIMEDNGLAENGLPDVPIWVTEYGINSISDISVPESLEGTEQTHAEHVIKGTIRSLANGISKLFWLGNIDKEGDSCDPPFCDMGLMIDDDTPKLSYYSYRKMTEKYNEISTQKIVPHRENKDEDGDGEGDGIYLYELRGKDVSYWLAWEDNDLHSTIDLVINGTEATVVDAVPDRDYGVEVDYDVDFMEVSVEVNDSTISLTLSRTPVFISVSP